ncbi:hypothetical protein FYJ24_07060 [Actinomycetaceae bacterium WB03_NA08]|uniref:Uncharacterized protein n=1 Tax=Scrofimicrobium canadense TaxID=2652290 RepID=A0A6N7VRX1_9ACTO|nr:hypothetical protein [Scrofimicrobium canadense]MSS84527.1 hypothetical protein [Scrofimicrobium canadense]
MAIREVTFYQVQCDRCGLVCTDYGDFSAMFYPDEAIECMPEDWVSFGGGVFCDACADTAAIVSRLDEALERAKRQPALGDPDDALESYGFPEPLCDGRLHPVMAGSLRIHMQISRSR